jgi:phospholipase C
MGEGPAIPVAGRRPKSRVRHYAAIAAATVTGAGFAVGATVASASAAPTTTSSVTAPAGSLFVRPHTATPIKHLVVIFDENVSFDHYFGTYPNAANTDGNPFHAKHGTPSVNGLTPALLNHNPNLGNPQRLTPAEALTCDQGHGYTQEQKAFDNGKMDQFVQNTQGSGCTLANEVMDYYDGNTVTALWNYAMSDNNYNTNFGPSTPGALNVISGFDGASRAVNRTTGVTEPDPGTVSAPLNAAGLGTIYGDLDPYYDQCSDGNHTNNNPAIVVTYDDSDGWYDHQASKIVNGSDTAQDTALCATAAITLGSYPDRCGYGPRLPLLVISPWTRDNYVSHNLTDQSSVVKFIEDNWLHGKRIGSGSYDAVAGSLDAPGGVLDFHTVPHLFPVILNPNTGEVTDFFSL